MAITPVYPVADGVPLARTEAIVFDSGERIISVFYAVSGVEEVVYRAGRFALLYSRRSTRVGNRFTLLRHGGWPSAPTLQEDVCSAAASESLQFIPSNAALQLIPGGEELELL